MSEGDWQEGISQTDLQRCINCRNWHEFSQPDGQGNNLGSIMVSCKYKGNIPVVVLDRQGCSLFEADRARYESQKGIAPRVTFATITLPEALKNRAPREWLVKGFIPREGIMYIGGPPKCYKTTVAAHLALSVAVGRKLFDHFDIEGKPRCVLFIEEENEVDLLEKMALLIKAMNLSESEQANLSNIHLSLSHHITIDKEGGSHDVAVTKLLSKVEELQPDIIIFDSLVRLMEGDENKSSDARLVHETLKAIGKDRHTLSVLLHHTPKPRSNGKDKNSDLILRGSGDFIAQADVVLMLSSAPFLNGRVYASIPYNRAAPGDFNNFAITVSPIDSEGNRTSDVDEIVQMRVDYLEMEEKVAQATKCAADIQAYLADSGFKEFRPSQHRSKFVGPDLFSGDVYKRAVKILVDNGALLQPEDWRSGQGKRYLVADWVRKLEVSEENVD